jgi:hypothetical protein
VGGITYPEGLEVIKGQLVASQVEESILKHAAMAVAIGLSMKRPLEDFLRAVLNPEK